MLGSVSDRLSDCEGQQTFGKMDLLSLKASKAMRHENPWELMKNKLIIQIKSCFFWGGVHKQV